VATNRAGSGSSPALARARLGEPVEEPWHDLADQPVSLRRLLLQAIHPNSKWVPLSYG
jgi:hypothetical protein